MRDTNCIAQFTEVNARARTLIVPLWPTITAHNPHEIILAFGVCLCVHVTRNVRSAHIHTQ